MKLLGTPLGTLINLFSSCVFVFHYYSPRENVKAWNVGTGRVGCEVCFRCGMHEITVGWSCRNIWCIVRTPKVKPGVEVRPTGRTGYHANGSIACGMGSLRKKGQVGDSESPGTRMRLIQNQMSSPSKLKSISPYLIPYPVLLCLL